MQPLTQHDICWSLHQGEKLYIIQGWRERREVFDYLYLDNIFFRSGRKLPMETRGKSWVAYRIMSDESA